jgi:hypothetical protein
MEAKSMGVLCLFFFLKISNDYRDIRTVPKNRLRDLVWADLGGWRHS